MNETITGTRHVNYGIHKRATVVPEFICYASVTFSFSVQKFRDKKSLEFYN